MDKLPNSNASYDYLLWLIKINNGQYCDNKYIEAFMENNIDGQYH